MRILTVFEIDTIFLLDSLTPLDSPFDSPLDRLIRVQGFLHSRLS